MLSFIYLFINFFFGECSPYSFEKYDTTNDGSLELVKSLKSDMIAYVWFTIWKSQGLRRKFFSKHLSNHNFETSK